MRESGYFLPHVVIGYAGTVIAALGTWPVLYYLFGVRNATVTLSIMVAVALLFGVWFVRYSKVLWLALDLTFHPPHSEDFESRGRPE
jgi:Na+/melibiose symporter-like transporter